MTVIIMVSAPATLALIYGIFKAITNHDNNKTRLEMYKLAIEAGHKHGMIDNEHTIFQSDDLSVYYFYIIT